jgi:hypothetical protein
MGSLAVVSDDKLSVSEREQRWGERECEVEKMEEDSPWAHTREGKASTHVGRGRRLAVTSARRLSTWWHDDRVATGHKATLVGLVLSCSDERVPGPLAYRPALKFVQYSKSAQTCKFKFSAFPRTKNIQNMHEARFEYFETLSPLGQLKIPTG